LDNQTDVDCFGDTTGALSITAGGGTPGYTYNWTGGVSDEDLVNLGAGTYDLTVSDANSCTATASYTITENPQITVDLGNDTTVCEGESVEFDAGVFDNYLWNNGVSAQQTIIVDSAYTYIVTVSDALGCTASDTVILSNYALPVVDLGTNNSACTGDTVTLDAGVFSSYKWNTTENTQTVKEWNIGTYTYIVTVTDVNGCTASDTTDVSIQSSLVVNLGGDQNVCSGDSLILDAGSWSSYEWISGNTDSTEVVTATGQYGVVVTDANGCSGGDTVNISMVTLPTRTLISDTTLCEGEITVLDAGAGYDSYNWKSGSTQRYVSTDTTGEFVVTVGLLGCTRKDTASVTITLPPTINIGQNYVESCNGDTTIFQVASGFAKYEWSTGDTTYLIRASKTGTYSVTVGDVNGCESIDDVELIVYPVDFNIFGDTTVCQGESTILHTQTAGDHKWFVDGLEVSNDSVINVTPDIMLPNLIQLSVVDTNGCLDTIERTIQVEMATPVTGLDNQQVCEGETATFSVSTSDFSAFNWSTPEGSFTSSTINVDTKGWYKVTATDRGNGCFSYDSAELTVNLNPDIAIGKDANANCDGTVTLRLQYNHPEGRAFNQLTWNDGNTDTVRIISSNGYYHATVLDVLNCQDTAGITVTVPEIFDVSLPDNTLNLSCYGDRADVQPTVSGGNGEINYQWSDSSGVVISTEEILSGVLAGVYQLSAIDASGCTSSDTLYISQPSALIEDTVITEPAYCEKTFDGIADIYVEGGTAPYTYLWSDEEEGSYRSDLAHGRYEVLVKDINNCKTIVTVVIDIENEDCISIPTSFTPNSDGVHDYWDLKNIEQFYPEAKIFVYDRWGRLVYSNTNYSDDNAWDGTKNGVPLPTDSYHFIIEKGGGEKPITGQITLLR
jgi:gliding motility-associated-like protein